MGENTEIGWTDHTFNPWWGCVRVSPGCEHCYAETLAKRVGQKVWGVDAPRRFFGDAHWSEPLKWHEAALKRGVRERVFCASMADVFEDRPDLEEPRARLFRTIMATTSLDWQLLTKRPENLRRMLPPEWLVVPQYNVWLMTTAEDQRRLEERVPLLLDVPAVVHGISAEPLLGPVDLGDWIASPDDDGYCTRCGLSFDDEKTDLDVHECPPGFAGRIDWVIVGGESGPGARPCDLAWIRAIVSQCREAGTPVFVKQLGSVPMLREDAWRAGDSTQGGGAQVLSLTSDGPAVRLLNASNRDRVPHGFVPLATVSRKGGDMAEWPEDCRVREFPPMSKSRITGSLADAPKGGDRG